MIKHCALRHPWPYHYFVNWKHSQTCSFESLASFLQHMFLACPHKKFMQGPRSSALKTSTHAFLHEIKNHEVCRWAREGLEWNMQGTGHGNVQLWMLQHDRKTIGVEVPVWLDEEELAKVGIEFKEKGSLSGHIDVLRIENETIWIWDYKPKAKKEKWADTQVFMYALMLSKRTNIPLQNFMCGYFDENTSFIFKPSTQHIPRGSF